MGKNTKEYIVTWTIQVSAPNHEEASELAMAILRNHESITTIMTVIEQGKKDGLRREYNGVQ